MPKLRKHKEFKPRKVVHKIPHGVSKEENELANAIALDFPGVAVTRSNRQVLKGRELDIYLPSRALAIEFDGNYFHDSKSKDISYHLHKTVECEKQGIRLIHIFSDEWETKKHLVINHIRRALGKYQTISAEDCIVRPISPSERKFFFDNSCLNGDDSRATGSLGMYYKGDIVSAISYIENRDTITILRYCDRPSIKVNSALGEFLKEFKKDVEAIVDRRSSDGLDFKLEGFEIVEVTDPNPYYTKDYKKRIPWYEYKLSESTKEYTMIYDCGNIVMKKKTSS